MFEGEGVGGVAGEGVGVGGEGTGERGRRDGCELRCGANAAWVGEVGRDVGGGGAGVGGGRGRAEVDDAHGQVVAVDDGEVVEGLEFGGGHGELGERGGGLALLCCSSVCRLHGRLCSLRGRGCHTAPKHSIFGPQSPV